MPGAPEITSGAQQALALAAAEQKISLDDARRMMGWYDFTLKPTDRDVANLATDQEFMIEPGMLKKRIDVGKDLIAARFPCASPSPAPVCATRSRW